MRVLLVEDNEDHQRLMHSALREGRGPVSVRTVRNREEFLEAARCERFDCVVLDFHVGEHTAPALLREAESALDETPVLIVSSSAEQRVVIESLRTGVADFVPKEDALEGETLWRHIEAAVVKVRQNLHRRRQADRRLRALQRACETDPLTGLSNRRGALRVLNSARVQADRRRVASCVMLDLDHFKQINDHYGHVAGDAVLKRVAGVILAQAEPGDVCARWGGEEFLAVKVGCPLVHAWAWADRVSRAVSAERVPVPGGEVAVTVSVGVATVPTGELSEGTVALADRALYLAKDLGRDRVCTWPTVRALEVAETIQADPRLSAEERVQRLLQAMRATLSEAQVEQTGPHCRLARELAVRIGRAMQLGEGELEVLGLAAGVHDIGKVVMPEEVLGKAAALTPEEKRFVDEHARVGAVIARGLGIPAEVADVIGWDQRGPGAGGGPAALARIVAVADAVAAMVTDRPYAPRRTLSQALAELRRCSGRQFDPEVVSAVHFINPGSLACAA